MREGESREYKKGTSERTWLYLCGGRGWAVRGRESDGALYPIGRAAKPGGCDSEFYITKDIFTQDVPSTPVSIP